MSKPPPTRREVVVETLHGVAIEDPYRWLEDGTSPEVRAWSAAQTAHAERTLTSLPCYEDVRARVTELLRIGSVEAPIVAGSRYFHRRGAADQDQPVLYVRDGLSGRDRAILDPNALSSGGATAPIAPIAIDWWVPSWDGRFVAYGLSERGSEDSTLRVLDVDTGQNLPETEVISRTRYASIAWLPDGSGFFYTRYPARGTVPEGEESYRRRIYEHRLGRDPDLDPLVFGDQEELVDMPFVDISPNGRWLVVLVHRGWSRRELYLKDLSRGLQSPWIPLAAPEHEGSYDAVVRDDHLLVRTNVGAPSYRLYRVDPARPERPHWREIVAPSAGVLASYTEIGGEIVTAYIHDARSILKRFTCDGAPIGDIPLPTLGAVHTLRGAAHGREVFFDFTAFTMPTRVLRFDLDEQTISCFAEVEAPIDPSAFIVEQETTTSRDGTTIPMFITRLATTPRDGSAPALLTGYGGFSSSQLPSWSGPRHAFLERGGIHVLATLRGGGEYGESWHRAGMLGNKQNVFDDAIAVAEHMIASKLTSRDRLAIAGGSNGGLLVGAVVTQRPDLFRAAVCLVPLLDMIRYHRFLIARLWIPEYGSSEDPRQFEWLHAYSPYQRFDAGSKSPAMLFATAESDTRVDPLHARKMAALMQSASTPERPVLLRIEADAGHGAGKPIGKRVDEAAMTYAFLFWQLSMAGEQPINP